MATSHRIPWKAFFGIAAAVYLLTGYFNPGFIALDDYSWLTAFYIPAQFRTVEGIVANADIQSPLPRVVLLGIARVFWFLGAEEPLRQYALVRSLIALLSVGIFYRFGRRALSWAGDPRLEAIGFGLLALFFASPLLFTRSMLESLSAPFLLASAVLAMEYRRQDGTRAAVLAVVFLGVAASLRFQTGVCLLPLAAIVLARKQPRDIGAFALAGAGIFLATGLLDLWWRGTFHHSLRAYLGFNLAHASEVYGRRTWYFYFPLLVAVTLPPTFFLPYRGLRWRERFEPLLPVVAYLITFVVAHTLIPHKEERFMIPIIPLMLLLIAPLLHHLWLVQRARGRVAYFLGLNAVLLVGLSTNVPQRAVIETMRFLSASPGIDELVEIGQSLAPYPDAFLSRPVRRTQVDGRTFAATPPTGCDTVAVVRSDWAAGIVPSETFVKVAEFQPAWADALVIRLNPGKNARRGALSIYAPAECQRR